jgi:hypothetical protein
MFHEILIANRGERVRAASALAKPHRAVREAHAGDLASMEHSHV